MDTNAAPWVIELFFDGDCPLCVREIALMRARNKHDKVLFTDIAKLSLDGRHDLPTMETLMGQIHARDRAGTWFIGVEAFRRVYAELGFATLARWSRAPGIDFALRKAYDVFARNRLRWTGRCENGTCEVPKMQDA